MKHVMSKLRDVSEKMLVHRTSEAFRAKGSDQFGSEQPASEGSLADCSKQSGPSEHGISENRPADGSKQLGSSEGAVSGMFVSDPVLSVNPSAKAPTEQPMM